MAKSNAERQERFRYQQQRNHKRRFNGYVSVETWVQLGSLAAYYGISRQAMIERAVAEADARAKKEIAEKWDSDRQSAYIYGQLRKDGTVVK